MSLLFIAPICINAQVSFDSSRLWKLLNQNDLEKETTIDNSAVSTNTGSFFKEKEESKNEQIIVITGEIINQLNYNTLADILRDLPQFLVNQPGTAIQGEGFYAAGLNGNEHYRILINGVSVYNNFSSGFPIAGNLPIRQAQRIEITFNPSGAVYAPGAALGVINIITPQTERPLYIRAALNGFSSNFNNMSLLLGGKFGKGKNIVRFDVYGNFKKQNNINLQQDTSALSFYSYPYAFYPYANNNNFKQLPPDNGPVEHSSDLTGANVYFRNYHLTLYQWSRKDQSSNGLNSLTMYRDIANFFMSDRQFNFSLTKDVIKKREATHYQIQYVQYNVKQGSSSKMIFPDLKRAAFDYLLENFKGTVPIDSVPKLMNRNIGYLDRMYFDQVRFTVGSSRDLMLSVTKRIDYKYIKLDFGYTLNIAGGTMINRYSRSPILKANDSNQILYINSKYAGYFLNNNVLQLSVTSNFYGNLNFKINKFSFDLGGNMLIEHTSFSQYFNNIHRNVFFNPYAKIVYHKNAETRYYLNYTSSNYNCQNNLLEKQYTFTQLNRDSMVITKEYNAPALHTTKQQVTLGLNNLFLFYSVTRNLPVTGFFDTDNNYYKTPTTITNKYGTYLIDQSKLMHLGLTLMSPNYDYNADLVFRTKKDSLEKQNWKVKLRTLLQISGQRFVLPNQAGIQRTNYYVPSNKAVLFFGMQYRLKLDINIIYSIQNEVRPSFYYENILPKKQTIDLIFRYQFSKQFSANLKIFNITGTDLYGSQATGTSSDLYLQPQSSIKTLFSINYALE